MKKIIILCGVLLSMSGCTMSRVKPTLLDKNKQFKIEKNAELKILVDDVGYADAMLSLWNKTYPKHEDALHIVVTPSSDKESYDIQWLSDSEAWKQRQHFYDISEVQEQVELHVEDHLQSDAEKFLPVEGKGLVFLYNEQVLHKRNGTKKDMEDFEHLQDLGEHVYYHNRDADYVYPFLFTPHVEVSKDWLETDELYDNIERYRMLNKELSIIDDQLERNDFYLNGTYLCGLVQNDGSYMKNNLYKKGKLHFTYMPSYKGISFHPVVDTYGFVIAKDTKYPGAASAFLELVRSEKGMKQWINTTTRTPLIAQEDCKEYFVFDHTRKELILAMNGSQLRDHYLTPYLKNNALYSIVQNVLYTEESNSSLKKRIKQDIAVWKLQ